MIRFTLPRDLYHGKDALAALKTLTGKKAMICTGGSSMKKFGFLDKTKKYLEEAGMEVAIFEGIEPDPSVETIMRGAAAMLEFEPDWIVAIGGGSPIDAAKAMWIKYEYPQTTFEDMCVVFGIPKLRNKARFCAISSTSGTATEVTAFSIITDYQKGVKYPIADYEIADAHARFDALSRRYQYLVSEKKDPFDYETVCCMSLRGMDFGAMNEAAKTLYDYTDFTSFSKLHTDVKTNNCRIDEARWEKDGTRWVFTIQADRFLRNMVRAMVGTMFEVGRGKRSVDDFRRLIEAKDRCRAGTSAPPEGLTLIDIDYPDNLFTVD